jgi:hypothetical protein
MQLVAHWLSVTVTVPGARWRGGAQPAVIGPFDAFALQLVLLQLAYMCSVKQCGSCELQDEAQLLKQVRSWRSSIDMSGAGRRFGRQTSIQKCIIGRCDMLAPCLFCICRPWCSPRLHAQQHVPSGIMWGLASSIEPGRACPGTPSVTYMHGNACNQETHLCLATGSTTSSPAGP